MPQPSTPNSPARTATTQQGDPATTSSLPSTSPVLKSQPQLLAGALLYPTLAIIGVSCLTWALRRRSASKPKMGAVDPDAIATVSELASLRADLNELGERLAQRLDRKAGELEDLLTRAERAAEELRRLRASTTQAGTRPVENPLKGDGFIETIAPLDPLHARVAELADKGFTAVQIAQRLEQPTGQVELILALRRRFVRAS